MTIDKVYRLATFRGLRNLKAEREWGLKRLEGIDFGEGSKIFEAPENARGIWVRSDLPLVFQTLLKSGSTSMRNYFHEVQKKEAWTKTRARPLHRLSRKSARLVGSSRKFTQARNPYTRVLSAFVEKNPRPQFAQVPGMGDLSPDGFAKFLRFLQTGGLHEDRHWMPMVDQLSWPVEAFDYILHLENLQSEFQRMLDEENLFHARKNGTGEPHWVDKHRPGKVTGSGRLLNDFYTPQLEKIVSNLYQDDFASFGYKHGLANV